MIISKNDESICPYPSVHRLLSNINSKAMKNTLIFALVLMISTTVSAKKIKTEVISNYEYGIHNSGSTLVINFQKGKEFNHPLFALWLADEDGKYIQTLYVSESIGKGVFVHGKIDEGQWKPGEIERPAALAYWVHQRNFRNEKNGLLPTPQTPVIDAYTGATPQNSFILEVTTEQVLKGKYKLMLELNQSWDWNSYWHNNRYPDDEEYKTSCQPAIIYSADINTEDSDEEIILKPLGHSHYSGADGTLYKDLSTLTTALKIAKIITVKIK